MLEGMSAGSPESLRINLWGTNKYEMNIHMKIRTNRLQEVVK